MLNYQMVDPMEKKRELGKPLVIFFCLGMGVTQVWPKTTGDILGEHEKLRPTSHVVWDNPRNNWRPVGADILRISIQKLWFSSRNCLKKFKMFEDSSFLFWGSRFSSRNCLKIFSHFFPPVSSFYQKLRSVHWTHPPNIQTSQHPETGA